MVDAAPFPALRYDPAVAGDPASTSAPAYDDLERFAYAHHRTASPYTVVELIAAAEPGDYDAAAAAYQRWRRTGVLVTDPEPAFYLYEEHELRHGVPAVQRGLLAAVTLETGPSSAVLPHELVLPERVDERLQRLRAVPADLSPVYAFYEHGAAQVQDLLGRAPRRAPIVAMTDEAGVDHRVWAITGPGEIAAIRRALQAVRVVIADGHHRYATALAYQQRAGEAAGRNEGAEGRDGAGAYEGGRILMYLVDARRDGPEVRAIHRLVRPMPARCLARLGEDFTLTPAPADATGLQAALGDASRLCIGLRLPGGASFVLTARDEAALRERLPAHRAARWRDLDAALLDGVVLPALDVRTGAVQYRADTPSAIAEVDAGGRGGLFVLRPVPIATVAALALAGEPMPPKTTWFRPKPRTGLIMRELDPPLVS